MIGSSVQCIMSTIIFFISLVSMGFVQTMSSTNLATFFPQIRGNLTKVTWAHAVNNMSYLENTLKNGDIMMLEADIVLGQLNGVGNAIPVMGHPPANVSDLSLVQFLTAVDIYNKHSPQPLKKGVKLDFKSLEVFMKSLPYVLKFNKGTYPLWINADILPGPIRSTAKPVDAFEFLQSCKSFRDVILSIGWTTKYGPDAVGSYTDSQILSMLETIKENKLHPDQEITFPVRAGLVAESLSQMEMLLSSVDKSTLTIWSSSGDNVNVTNLRNLIGVFGSDRIYVDVPVGLMSQLRLDTLPSGGNTQNNEV